MINKYNLHTVDSTSESFLDLPNRIYSKSEIPHTSKPKEKHLIGCYVLFDTELVVGRFALYDNPTIKISDEKTILIGSYECINDIEVSKELIKRVKEKALELGASQIIGPMEGSTWQNYRFTISDEPKFFTEMIHQPYYPNHFLKSGFKVLKSYSSTIDSKIEVNENRLMKFEKRVNDQNLVVRNIDLNNFKNELLRIGDFCNSAFKSNYLFSELDSTLFSDKYVSIKDYVKEELLYIVEDSEGEMQGFLFCIPNYFDEKGESIIVKSMAILPKRNLAGLGIYLGEIMYKKALELGFTKAIHAYMIDENKSIGLSNRFNAEKYKTHHLYICKL